MLVGWGTAISKRKKNVLPINVLPLNGLPVTAEQALLCHELLQLLQLLFQSFLFADQLAKSSHSKSIVC